MKTVEKHNKPELPLLAVDIGNTNVVCARYCGNEWSARLRLATDLNFWSELAAYSQQPVSGVVISSVVPRLTAVYQAACRNLFNCEPVLITYKNAGLTIDVPNPSEAGADRICNVVGASHLHGSPAIVVDFGTATTYDVVDESGTFIGGAIAPGIEVSAGYLFHKAALLRDTALQWPKEVIGRDTVTNLQSGIMFGAVDSVNGMLMRILTDTGWTNSHLVLTGGFGQLISPHVIFPHILAPDLTLDGMRIIYQRENA